MNRRRWMALSFAIGSACFLVGPFPGFHELVGSVAVGWTFFAGSIFFTIGGALQSWLSFGHGRAAWWSSLIQSAGTLFFNVSTFQALDTGTASAQYDTLVWRPDWRGSLCFLVSGVIAYVASPRHGWWPRREGPGWWQPAVNLLGCAFFGISAVAGFVVPSHGSELDLAAANWTTALGAACFLACALDTLRTGEAPKTPRLGRLRRLELAVDRDVRRVL